MNINVFVTEAVMASFKGISLLLVFHSDKLSDCQHDRMSLLKDKIENMLCGNIQRENKLKSDQHIVNFCF